MSVNPDDGCLLYRSRGTKAKAWPPVATGISSVCLSNMLQNHPHPLDSDGNGAQGRRTSGRAGGSAKELKAMETYKTMCLFLFSNNVDLKHGNQKLLKSHSEFFGCANSYKNFVFKSVLIDRAITDDTVMKRHLRPRYEKAATNEKAPPPP